MPSLDPRLIIDCFFPSADFPDDVSAVSPCLHHVCMIPASKLTLGSPGAATYRCRMAPDHAGAPYDGKRCRHMPALSNQQDLIFLGEGGLVKPKIHQHPSKSIRILDFDGSCNSDHRTCSGTSPKVFKTISTRCWRRCAIVGK